jgi:hypothetical protein
MGYRLITSYFTGGLEMKKKKTKKPKHDNSL